MSVYYNEIDPKAIGFLDRKPKFFWRIVHSVNKSMACGTQHPHHFRPLAVLGITPSTIPFMIWFVCYIQNARFPTRLAFGRSTRVVSAKAYQITVWKALLFCTVPVFGFTSRVTKMKFTHRLRYGCFPALIGTEPFVVLPRIDRKLSSARSTSMLARVRRVRFSICRFAFPRTVFPCRIPIRFGMPAIYTR